jgi:hypothetical protein
MQALSGLVQRIPIVTAHAGGHVEGGTTDTGVEQESTTFALSKLPEQFEEICGKSRV